MAKPEIPHPEEFARENQFRVEIPDRKRLLSALRNENRKLLGIYESEHGLFSKIRINNGVENNGVENNGHVLFTSLVYRNPNDRYWETWQQAKHLQELLLAKNYNPVVPDIGDGFYHSLFVTDRNAKLSYQLNLGYENEEIGWKHEVDSIEEDLNKPVYKNDPVFYPALIKELDRL